MTDALFSALSALRTSKVAIPVRRASFLARMWTATHGGSGAMARMYARWGQYKRRQDGLYPPEERVVTARTELVIDGFMGSANTFATHAFRNSQRRPVRLAHHLHSAVDVLEATRLGIPAIITIREPEATALSVVSRWTFLDLQWVLRAYCWYYEALLEHRGAFVLSAFHDTTTDFGQVIAQANARFSTDFDLFEHTEENVVEIRRSPEARAPREAERRLIKEGVRAHLDKPDCRRQLDRARAVYAAFIGTVPNAPERP